MADVEDPTIVVDDERPIAVRRKRRSSVGPSVQSHSTSRPTTTHPDGMATPPATPKRSTKRVRFHDPSPETESVSTGLTPFVRRTSLATPTSKGRQNRQTQWNRAEHNGRPLSGTLQFAPLRQILDGRVKRRLKRNRLSEEINRIEWDKKNEAKDRKSEVQRLREELALKDLEVQSMRDEQDIASQIGGESGGRVNINTTSGAKVQELEEEIRHLKAELQRRETATMEDPDWTLAARDPFNFDDDDENMITNYDDDFRTSLLDDEMITTPTRLNTSFSSPPSTMPNTPCKLVSSVNAGIQASLPILDPEKGILKTQLQSLEAEISKLTAAIAFNSDNSYRLTQKLSDFIHSEEPLDHTTLDSALDTVLTQLALSQAHALDRSAAFSALSNEITSLGFSSSGPESTVETIVAQFRQARLELEYLTPGEVVEGFENEKLLDMLVSRIRILLKKVQERDDSIDQYHEQELLLRQQLNTRCDAMDDMKKELFLANDVIGNLRDEIKEQEIGNERLKSALERYREEVSNLESLIERMESEHQSNSEQLRSEILEAEARLRNEIVQHDTSKADVEGKEIIVMELERRLTAALQAAAVAKRQLDNLAAAEKGSKTEQHEALVLASQRERDHGTALALRDARVSELRNEIARVNEALQTAHSTILSLRKENNELVAQVDGEKSRGLLVVNAMRDQLMRVVETGTGYVTGDGAVQGPSREAGEGSMGSPSENASAGVVRKGGMFDASLVRRGSKSGKKRRRYDSGLGFLGEEDEETASLNV